MARIDERVAHLEGQVSELSISLVDIRTAVRQLEQRMDARFEGVDRRFDAVDRRFDAVDSRFDAVDRRFDAINGRFDGVDGKIEGLDAKMSRQFVWLVGLVVTALVAMVGAVLSRG